MNKNLTIKLGAIALLILLLLIPLLMIDGIIDDRQQLRDGVLEDIARSSSYSQQLSGPLMVVPYRKVVRTWKTNEKTSQRYEELGEERGRLYFLPERFELDGQVQTELRNRGYLRSAAVPCRQSHQWPFLVAGAVGDQGRLRRLPV
jgi:inner membrane protein